MKSSIVQNRDRLARLIMQGHYGVDTKLSAVHMSNLRDNFDVPSSTTLLRTLRAIGYQLP
jgi:DNA-binding response OmpR family regulator